ncbi:MAG: hypothetical protein SOZ62_06620 [Eubacteriales bacterium]|nr:hypothetical protein [Eubacteriales bacterium]
MAQFRNQAQLSYNGTTVNSNVTVGEIIETLSVTKNAVTENYTISDDVTYIISIRNTGSTNLSGVTVTDNLGSYIYNSNTLYPLTYIAGSAKVYLDGVLQATPTVNAGPPLVLSGLSIPSGGNLIIVYEAIPNQYAPTASDSTITNTATVSANGGNTATAEETVSVISSPNLSISKSLSPVSVEENGTVTYTFLIQNYGNKAAEYSDNVTVTDVFTPILSSLTATLNGTPLALTTGYTYDTGTGTFRTVPGVITVPAATYVQNDDGTWTITPGTSVLTVTGTV